MYRNVNRECGTVDAVGVVASPFPLLSSLLWLSVLTIQRGTGSLTTRSETSKNQSNFNTPTLTVPTENYKEL